MLAFGTGIAGASFKGVLDRRVHKNTFLLGKPCAPTADIAGPSPKGGGMRTHP